MQYRGLNELREMYLKFFETKGHLRLPSLSLIHISLAEGIRKGNVKFF